MKKIFVLGRRFCGKTPFSIEVAEACGLQHVEASNWLRKQFESSDFAMMLLDAELMNDLTLNELRHRPDACSDYVKHKLSVGRDAIIDGVFSERDFVTLFDPAVDSVVILEHLQSSIKPTSYEEGLDAIEDKIGQLEIEGRLASKRVHRYRFDVFRDKRGEQRFHRIDGGINYCYSLEQVIELASAICRPQKAVK
jgi:hypothetical protein